MIKCATKSFRLLTELLFHHRPSSHTQNFQYMRRALVGSRAASPHPFITLINSSTNVSTTPTGQCCPLPFKSAHDLN